MPITYFFGTDEASKAITAATIDAAKQALQDADTALAAPESPPAAAARQTWFGADIAGKRDRIEKLRNNIRTMRSCLNSWNVTIVSGGSDPSVNAACFSPVFTTAKGHTESSWAILTAVSAKGGSQKIDLPGGDSIQPQHGRFLIVVYNNFLRMPLDGAHDPSAGHDQDRIETLIHEMSHAIAGTKDHALRAGASAYGRTGALALVLEDPAKAFENAENWGMFCAALRT